MTLLHFTFSESSLMTAIHTESGIILIQTTITIIHFWRWLPPHCEIVTVIFPVRSSFPAHPASMQWKYPPRFHVLTEGVWDSPQHSVPPAALLCLERLNKILHSHTHALLCSSTKEELTQPRKWWCNSQWLNNIASQECSYSFLIIACLHEFIPDSGLKYNSTSW